MRFIANLLWIICGGFISYLGWIFTGLLYFITIIGIPVGIQCFKLASISLNPFGKEVRNEGGTGSAILNIFWIIFGGIELALTNAIIGVILCITIIGIPFGKQFFKIAQVALFPFGLVVERTKYV